MVNVGNSAFHEGRGAGKSTPRGVEKSMLIFLMRESQNVLLTKGVSEVLSEPGLGLSIPI